MIKMRSSPTITGDDLPFDDIAAVLGVEPTLARRATDSPKKISPCGRWVLDRRGVQGLPGPSRIGECTAFPHPEVALKFDQIRNAIGDRVEAFAGWRRDHSVEVWPIAAIQSEDDDPPTMAVSSDFVPFAALMGAGLDFDIHTNAGPLAEAP